MTTGPLKQWYQPLTVTGATGQSLTLQAPNGYRVHGTVSIGGTLPTGATVSATVTFVEAGTSRELEFQGTGTGTSISYDAQLAGASYTPTHRLTITVGSTTIDVVRTESPVVVCGDQVLNFTQPALPALATAAVSVTGLSAIPAADSTNVQFETATGDVRYTAALTSTPGNANLHSSATAMLPMGQQLRVTIVPSGSFGFARFPARLANPVTITSSVALTLPSYVNLTMNVTDPGAVLGTSATQFTSCAVLTSPPGLDVPTPLQVDSLPLAPRVEPIQTGWSCVPLALFIFNSMTGSYSSLALLEANTTTFNASQSFSHVVPTLSTVALALTSPARAQVDLQLTGGSTLPAQTVFSVTKLFNGPSTLTTNLVPGTYLVSVK